MEDLRPIQVDYPSQTSRPGGQTIVLWGTGAAFDEIRLAVDGTIVRIVPGTSTTAGLGDLAPGRREVMALGISGQAVIQVGAAIEILAEPPVRGIEAEGCLFHTYLDDQGGFLEYFWKNRDTPENPYVDFAISVNGVLQGFLDAPIDAYAFSKVPLGSYSIEVVAFTRNHLCEPGVINCVAEKVDPVTDPSCGLERCEAGQGRFAISYAMPESPASLDGVAAYDVTAEGRGKFLGNFPPGQPVRPPLLDPGEERLIELVAFRNDSASTVPGARGGAHVIVTCFLPAAKCSSPDFLRGDANGDGLVDISDDVFGLQFLFMGGDTPACLASCDLNLDGKFDISDPIHGLAFKFLGGPPPGPPFPDCGSDPAPGGLSCQRGC